MIPHYNTRTKKIYGALPGSLVWWHEAGHAWLDRAGFYASIYEPLIYSSAPLTITFLLGIADFYP
jgi:hypothetical protein